MEYCPYTGIMVTHRVDETQIDFDSSRYHPKGEATEQITADEKISGHLRWSLELLESGHIGCYFSSSESGPLYANIGVGKMVDYIHNCAIAGP